MTRDDDLRRIREALEESVRLIRKLQSSDLEVGDKGGGDPVTEVDLAVDRLLRGMLPAADEGWLSEETADDRARLEKGRVWVVDPLDGTREFVSGVPEWCVSIGLVEEGEPVAGGISNPASGETVLGSRGTGVRLNGRAVRCVERASLDGAVILASRSEIRRGEWERFRGASFSVRPTGSVAYKLALVAAGVADATWSLAPKHEWDIAAGVALVRAAGGAVRDLDGAPLRFNQERPWVNGLIATPPSLLQVSLDLVKPSF